MELRLCCFETGIAALGLSVRRDLGEKPLSDWLRHDGVTPEALAPWLAEATAIDPLLAEEMEFVARYVDAHSGEGRADSDGLEALMRAMEQLPSYVERVASGARDLPLVLLPLLNDLRAVRGAPLLSEGTLLSLNLSSEKSPAELLRQ